MKDSKRQKIRKAILQIWPLYKAQGQFKSGRLVWYVRNSLNLGENEIFADTILKELRTMKQLKMLNYECPVRSKMIYHVKDIC
jgi:hypothetical protein